MSQDNNSEIQKMSFEEALAELEKIVDSLESGNIAMEESISRYTRGAALRDHCQKKLADAKLQIEKITVSSDGEISTEQF